MNCSQLTVITNSAAVSVPVAVFPHIQLWVTRQHFLTFIVSPNPSPKCLCCLALKQSCKRTSFPLSFPYVASSRLTLGQSEDEMTSCECVHFFFFSDYYSSRASSNVFRNHGNFPYCELPFHWFYTFSLSGCLLCIG